jgi:hypothetical protein
MTATGARRRAPTLHHVSGVVICPQTGRIALRRQPVGPCFGVARHHRGEEAGLGLQQAVLRRLSQRQPSSCSMPRRRRWVAVTDCWPRRAPVWCTGAATSAAEPDPGSVGDAPLRGASDVHRPLARATQVRPRGGAVAASRPAALALSQVSPPRTTPPSRTWRRPRGRGSRSARWLS